MKDWKSETRTAVEFIEAIGACNLSALARRIGMKPGHLLGWVSDPRRGLCHENEILIRDHLGIPCIAIREKSRPIGEAVSEELKATG